MKFEKSDVRPFFIEKNINKLIELSITADDATEILNAVFDLSGEAWDEGYLSGLHRDYVPENEVYEEDIETLGMSEQEW